MHERGVVAELAGQRDRALADLDRLLVPLRQHEQLRAVRVGEREAEARAERLEELDRLVTRPRRRGAVAARPPEQPREHAQVVGQPLRVARSPSKRDGLVTGRERRIGAAGCVALDGKGLQDVGAGLLVEQLAMVEHARVVRGGLGVCA